MKKVKTKDRSRSKAKFSSKDKTATASYKGNKTQKLQTKLISAFLIPIVLFICTGVLTYSVTSSALMKTYEKSTMTSMTTLSDYYSIVIYNVDTDKLKRLVESYAFYQDTTELNKEVAELMKNVANVTLKERIQILNSMPIDIKKFFDKFDEITLY